MKIYVKAKPKSKIEFVKKIDTTHYNIAVKEPPIKGKANLAVIKSLAKYFNKSPSQISIISGETSKQKVLEVPILLDEISDLDIQKRLF